MEKRVKVFVDRPVGFVRENIVYSMNYGYIEELTALDGEFQDAYIIDESKAINEPVFGYVIAIIQRNNDLEDKLVISLSRHEISEKEIEERVCFQEKHFAHVIVW